MVWASATWVRTRNLPVETSTATDAWFVVCFPVYMFFFRVPKREYLDLSASWAPNFLPLIATNNNVTGDQLIFVCHLKEALDNGWSRISSPFLLAFIIHLHKTGLYMVKRVINIRKLLFMSPSRAYKVYGVILSHIKFKS